MNSRDLDLYQQHVDAGPQQYDGHNRRPGAARKWKALSARKKRRVWNRYASETLTRPPKVTKNP